MNTPIEPPSITVGSLMASRAVNVPSPASGTHSGRMAACIWGGTWSSTGSASTQPWDATLREDDAAPSEGRQAAAAEPKTT